MSNNLSPYGPSPPLNGTTADNSKSSQNVAATIAIASVLPILIAIFLLVMILMSEEKLPISEYLLLTRSTGLWCCRDYLGWR